MVFVTAAGRLFHITIYLLCFLSSFSRVYESELVGTADSEREHSPWSLPLCDFCLFGNV